MAKLVLSMDGLVLKEIPLTKERTTIGRKPHNDIQIDNLAISGEHAAITTIVNDAFLEDLNSTNGTYVNGQPVRKHFLQNQDVIELGKYRIKYVNTAASDAQPAPDMTRTTVMRPEAARITAAPVSRVALETQISSLSPQSFAATRPAAPVAPYPAACVCLLTGLNAGRELDLSKDVTTLGRPGWQVAAIARRPQGYFLSHVEGSEFPTVNGVALEGNHRCLADHDVIELAGVRMEFRLRPA